MGASNTKPGLTFYASDFQHSMEGLLLSPCTVGRNDKEAAEEIVRTLPPEIASNCRANVLHALRIGNVLRHGWSPTRTNPAQRLTFSQWDQFCFEKIGAEPLKDGRGPTLTLERLIVEVQELAARKKINLYGRLPVVAETPNANSAPKEAQRRKGAKVRGRRQERDSYDEEVEA